MSNLGFQTVYRLFNAADQTVCERVFLPSRAETQEMLDARTPLLTLESQSPVNGFDIFAFSVSFEWDYPNVLTLLRLAGLPLYAGERTARHPLVVIGGAITFLNPEPLAPFADVVAVGEGEALVPRLVDACATRADRSDLLLQLAGERGFYVPSFVQVEYGPDKTIARFVPRAGLTVPVRKATATITDATEPPVTTVFTPDTEFGSRLLIEAVRGCPNLCRFCWAGYNYLPVRPFSTRAILRLASEARPVARRVGLVSIALCDHPDIEEILRELNRMGYSISPASLRLDDLTESILHLLRASGENTITVAPETGSDRLRRVINKAFTNEEILDRAEAIFAAGIENLKLYYMIGLPTEADEDLVAVRDLTLAIRDRMLKHARRRGRIGRITASVNPLIPKPGTAYQWLPMKDHASLAASAKRLRGLMAGIDNLTLSVKSERHTYYQALLSLGDRRVAPAVEAASRNGGDWRAAVAEAGLDLGFYLSRDRAGDPVQPWDIIDGGVGREFLRAELDKALHGEWTLPPGQQGRIIRPSSTAAITTSVPPALRAPGTHGE
jgi:radical SAM superfamily enzyme YgiQ (UPF0313 family)